MKKIKEIILKFTPSFALKAYHISLSIISSIIYRFPSEKMIVIGVTGTKGKTTTSNFIWSCLHNSGVVTGIISTANIRIGSDQSLNKYHMTMPGRFAIQGLMRKMVNSGCKVCVVETTSEGLKQGRHIGINYDFAVFTNLTPEHLPSHNNSFENYKETKGKLFEKIGRGRHKKLKNIDPSSKSGEMIIEKIIIANSDSEHHKYFTKFNADKKITYGLKSGDYRAENISSDKDGVSFNLKGYNFNLKMIGEFNVYNALPAIIIGQLLNLPNETIKNSIAHLKIVPGRMELINLGQNFTVIVDYAHEKQSMTVALDSARNLLRDKNPQNKIIVLLGAEGGGRDKRKRPEMGKVVAEKADIVVITNVDPYSDDPEEIINDISNEVEKNPTKKIDQNLFKITDRREAIKKCFELAQEGDIVLLTGKGAEQSMIIGGKNIPWDDRVVAREELSALKRK